jgi:hypothetical protein
MEYRTAMLNKTMTENKTPESVAMLMTLVELAAD